MTLTFITHISILIQLVLGHRLIVSEKSTFSFFFLQKSLKYKICHKIGEGQPKATICTNYDGPEYPMLHTKIHRNRFIDSGEEYFESFFLI